MNERNENLRELFEQFLDSEQAQSNLEDIEKGEQILREHPAPEPDEMLLANIKAEIALHILPRRATVYKRFVYRAAAVAAVIIVIVAIGTSFLEKPVDIQPGPETYYASVFPWPDNDEITTHGANLVVLTAEIDQIENKLMTMESGEEYRDNDSTVAEMEIEVTEIAGDFWKG
jgi:hypothetical protein